MSPPQVFIIGGTGAQGIPIVQELVKDGAFTAHVLTRDQNSRRAKKLASLGSGVTFLEGSLANEATLREGFTGSEIAFINIDGFNTGEKAEVYWGIRRVVKAPAGGKCSSFHAALTVTELADALVYKCFLTPHPSSAHMAATLLTAVGTCRFHAAYIALVSALQRAATEQV